jgi:PadR family transcriptional regulator, regulatory protein PadR
MPRDILESVQSTLDFLILKPLSWGEMHGFAIARWIFDASGDELQIEQGTLCPALHRLEEQGWIDAEWKLGDKKRRAKFYRLTAQGRQQLTQRVEDWTRFTAAANRLLAFHSTTIHLLQFGVDITLIAPWPGHESTATTPLYVEAAYFGESDQPFRSKLAPWFG